MKQNKQPKRLDFLRAFMNVVGTNDSDLAKKMNKSRMTVARWFQKDDILLSNLRAIFRLFGYSIRILLSRSAYDDDEPIGQHGRLAFKYDKGNLPFLSTAMARCGVTARELAERLHVNVSTVQHMFASNDLRLSRVIDIAMALEMSIRVEIGPLYSCDNTRHEGRRFIARIAPLPRVIDQPLAKDDG